MWCGAVAKPLRSQAHQCPTTPRYGNQTVQAFVATDLEQTNVNNGKTVYPICPQIHSAPSFPWISILCTKTKMQDLSCKINRSYKKFLAYVELPPSTYFSCRIGIIWLFHLVKPLLKLLAVEPGNQLHFWRGVIIDKILLLNINLILVYVNLQWDSDENLNIQSPNGYSVALSQH